MGTQTDEIKVLFTADVSGLTDAQAKVKTGFDQLAQKAKGVTGQIDKATGGNLGLSKSLQTLSDVAKGGAARLAGLGAVAGFLLVKTFQAARDEANRSADSIAALSADAVIAANRLSTLSKESGISELGTQLKAAREQSRKLREEAGTRGNSYFSGGVFEMLRKGYNAGKDLLSPGRSIGDTEAEQTVDLDLAEKQAAQDEIKSQRLIVGALRDQSALARAIADGNSDLVATLSLEIERKRELNGLAAVGVKDEQTIAEVNQRYAAQLSQIVRARNEAIKVQVQEVSLAAMVAAGQTDRLAAARIEVQLARELESARKSGAGAEEISAIRERARLASKTAADQLSLSLAQFRVQQQIAGIAAKDLGEGRQQIEQNAARLRSIEEILKANEGVTDEQRRQLSLERDQIRAAQAQAGYARTRVEYEQAQALTQERLRNRGQSDEADLQAIRDETENRVRELDRSGAGEEALANERALGASRLNRARSEQGQRTKEFESARAAQAIERTNLDSKQKALKLAQEEERRAKEILATRKDLLTIEQKRQLELQIGAAGNAVRQAQQDIGFDLRNKPGPRNAELAKQARERAERDKFDRQQQKTGGLLNIARDINGNPVSGVDPATGQRVPFPGGGGAPKSLAEQVRATGTFGNTSLQGGSLLTDSRSLSERTMATGTFGNTMLDQPSGRTETKPLTAGEAAQQLAGNKEFLGSTKISGENKMLVIQQAQLQALQDIRSELTE